MGQGHVADRKRAKVELVEMIDDDRTGMVFTKGDITSLADTLERAMASPDLRARLGMLVYSVNWYQLPLLNEQGEDLNALFSAHEHRFGVHAGDVETSAMLALKPHAVRMDLAENFQSTSEQRAKDFPILGNGRSAKLAWQMQDYNPSGAAGNAAAATAENGRALMAAAGRSFAQLLFEIDRLPATTIRN